MDLPDSSGTKDLSGLEEILGHTFKDKGLLVECVQSKQSAVNLARLGDACLYFLVIERVYDMPHAIKNWACNKLVSNNTLKEIAASMGLEKYVQAEDGQRDLATAFEACVGAIYIDGGFDAVKKFVAGNVLTRIDKRVETFLSGSTVEERVYNLIWKRYGTFSLHYERKSYGRDPHMPNVTMGLYVRNELLATGSGPTNAEARQDAMLNLLAKLEKT